MSAAKSPRINDENVEKSKLRSTHTIDGSLPRQTQSVYQAVATARGYTIKAGSSTRARLHRGVPKSTNDLTNATCGSIMGSSEKTK